MIRFLIADDEKYVRDSIREVIQAAFAGKEEQFEIGEARNGREAIEVAEGLRPDIAIVDIKMPGIDGLKAIQEIRNFLPYCYFMVLTAYDYFDYAVEAVRNNVREYILKPFDRDELQSKIMEAVERVRMEKEKRKREIEYQEKIYNLIPAMENELSYSIVNDMIEVIDVEMYMDYLNMYFKNSFCMVVKLKGRNDNGNDYLSEGLKVQIGEHINLFLNQRYRAIGSYRFTEDLVYFVEVPSSSNTEEAKLSAMNLALDVKGAVKRFFGLSVRIGLGRCYNDVQLMHESYQEACKALEYSTENVSIIHYEDVENLIEKDGQFLEDRFKDDYGEKFALFKAVEQYIADNLKEDINLKDTAAKFNLSPYYFSRTFKKVFGYGFSDYLNLVRINKAKELLRDDSLSVKEIGYLVGYNDPNYFSKVFKKYEGVTPTEYREKLR